MQAPFMNTEEEEVKQLLNETGQDAEQEKLQEALEKLPSKRTGWKEKGPETAKAGANAGR